MKNVLIAILLIANIIFGGLLGGAIQERDWLRIREKEDHTSLLYKYAAGELHIPRGYKLYGLGCCNENAYYLLLRNKKEQEIYVKYDKCRNPIIEKSFFGRK